MTDRVHYCVDLDTIRERLENGEYAGDVERTAVDHGDPTANVVSSELVGTDDEFGNFRHAPALDIDIPCRVVPSSTEGHCHLYFDSLTLSWPAYVSLLQALARAGILEDGYVEASIERGATFLRMPGVTK